MDLTAFKNILWLLIVCLQLLATNLLVPLSLSLKHKNNYYRYRWP